MVQALRYFGERGKIVYVQFRDVQGVVPTFQECFIGDGNVDVVEALLTLKALGFKGFMIDDHGLRLVADAVGWAYSGHAHATGYMMGLVRAVTRLA